jgi:hypothetical protein
MIDNALNARKEKILNRIRRIDNIEKTAKEHIEYYISQGFILNEQWTILGLPDDKGYIVGLIVNKTEASYANYLLLKKQEK